VLWFSIIVGGLSASCWLAGAILTPGPSRWAHYGGPPPWIKRRMQIGSCLNGAAPLMVAVAISLQSAATCQLAANI
jgi:hypothetical protein